MVLILVEQDRDQTSRTKLEELWRMRYELQRTQNALEDRLGFLEEQNSAQPPPYAEFQMQSTDGAQTSSVHISPSAASVRSDYVGTLLILLWKIGQSLLRPRLRAGYRRLEWRCVRKSLAASILHTLIYVDMRRASLRRF